LQERPYARYHDTQNLLVNGLSLLLLLTIPATKANNIQILSGAFQELRIPSSSVILALLNPTSWAKVTET
jgi:hypothetical protein